MTEKLWNKVAKNVIKAGALPVPVSGAIIETLKILITEVQAKFLLLFKKPSYNIDEIKSKTDLDEESLNKMLKDLMYIGVITGIPSRSTGIMVYRLTPYFPGLLEFTLMRGEWGEKQKKIAELSEKFIKEMIERTQQNYDQMMSLLEKAPSIDRVIPVEEEIETREEVIVPLEELSRIIEEAETIGVQTCYCRHRKDLLGEPCKKTDNRKNCLSFGRAAEFTISQGFSERISKEEALKILKECEDEGLVHKAFHAKLDPNREIDGFCNCCKCCCGTFDIHYAGGIPIMDLTSYLAEVNGDNCVGCGTCVENCCAEAIELVDTIAAIDENRCIGCGVCAHLCPENAIKLNRTEPRKVFIPPPKLTNL